ncbi:MAG: TIM barrel protein [Anaerolineae bacterium]|nr:TIM barrel protein [Anaerolineae bacterium]
MTTNDHPTEMLRFGTVGSPATAPRPGTPAAIEYSRLLGLDHLEIAWVQSVRVSDETCATIKAAAEAHGITLSIHAPYYINLNSQSADLMRKSDERLLAAARKGFLAGARDIVFHPGSYHDQPPEEVYERIAGKLRELRTILDSEGVDVTLRPETMGKPAVFGTLEETLRLSRDIPGVLPCIDFAHLHARGGQLNSYEEFAAILDAVEAALGERGLHSLHAHLSGIAYGPRGERHHLPLNEADLQYRALLQALVDRGARGTVGVEAPEPFHVADALTLQATYRRLLENEAGEDKSSMRNAEEA